MKFSDKTMDVLKNFSTINQSVAFKKGDEIRTISPYKTIMAVAKTEDSFPGEAYVYDLNSFLGGLSLFSEPEVEFDSTEKNFVVSSDKSKMIYKYADKSMIVMPPEKDIQLPSVDIEVDVSWNDIQTIIKSAAVLQVNEIAFVGENGKIYLRAIDSDKGNKNNFGIEVGETEDEFIQVLKRDNIKLLEGDYKVSISTKGISKFESSFMSYYIAIEAKHSTFTKN